MEWDYRNNHCVITLKLNSTSSLLKKKPFTGNSIILKIKLLNDEEYVKLVITADGDVKRQYADTEYLSKAFRFKTLI